MKKIDMPTRLLDYMGLAGKFVFVNDFTGWRTDEINIPGFTYVPSMEGNAIRADRTGEIWRAQYCFHRRGNHLTVQLRDSETWTEEDLVLAEQPLFKDFPVVIITSEESLLGFAPICSNKMELALFIEAVREEAATRDKALDGFDYRFDGRAEDMVSLAKFLYRNNPYKTSCVLDEID